MRLLFATIASLALNFAGIAQTGSLFGKIQSAKGEPLPYFSIVLEGTPYGAYTDDDGNYLISNVDQGNYTLVATGLGYNVKRNSVEIIAGKTTTLNLQLEEAGYGLNEVVVTAKTNNYTSPVQAENGKLIYNIERTIAASGSTAFDLLQRTPGITVNGEDRLLLKGNVNTNVMIDGKMTYLSPAQLTNLLKSTPSENLARIEVISNPGSQYDAAGAAGVINIVTRKSTRQGYALDLNSGVGTGRYGQTAHSLAGNIRRGRNNFYAGYTFGYKKSLLHRTSYRTVVNDGVTTNYDRSADDFSTSNNHSYKAGVDIALAKTGELNLGFNGFNNVWNRNGSGPTYYQDAAGRSDSVVNNVNKTHEPSVNNGFFVRYKTSFDSDGKSLTADADFITYRNNSFGSLGNRVNRLDGTPLQPYEELRFQQPSDINIVSYKTDLVLPVNNMIVKAGLKYSDVNIDNNFRYDSLQGKDYVYSKLLSNHFIYTEKIAAAYGAVQISKGKTTCSLGLRVEHTASDADAATAGINTKRRYLNLFPNLSVTRTFGDDNVSLSFSRRINRPAYGDLNISRYFFDKFSYYEGNPYLRAEYAWSGELSYTLNEKYIATLGYTYTQDPILSFAAMEDATGNLRLTTKNFDRKRLYNLLLIAPWQPAKWWQVQQTANLYYQDFRYPLGDRFVNLQQAVVDLAMNNQFQMAKETRVEMNIHYTSPSPDGVYIVKQFFSVDAGVQQSLFDKKGTVRLSFTDLFRTTRYWGYLIDEAGQMRYDHRGDSRRINLALTYRIGGKLSAGKDRKLEEQQRL